MKKLSIATLLITLSVCAMSQDKKAGQGTFGIGFGLNTLPVQQNVFLSYYTSDNLEIGTALWFQYQRNRNSTIDTTPVNGTNGALSVNRDQKTVTSSTLFGIAPFIKYHFNTKNNLDVYTGGVIPFGMSTATKTVTTLTISGDNFMREGENTVTGPGTIIIGGGVLLGCRWFFYENLAVGAETNIGVLANIANGNSTSTSTLVNTGSNNPQTTAPNGNPAPTVSTYNEVKSDNETFSLMRSIGFNVTWYFGGGGHKAK